MRKNLLIFVFVIGGMLPKFSFGWSIAGHHMVAELAYLRLSESAKQKLKIYLSGTSIQDASTWMDEQKRNPSYQFLNDLHYINIEKGKPFEPGGKNNIYTELTEVMAELENINSLTPQKAKYDLSILIHLIGDLHQPLHVAYGEDKGGNTIPVTMASRKMNLHVLYDHGIIELKDIGTADILPQYARLMPNQISEIEKGGVADWINQTRTTLPFVYGFENGQINPDYINKATPLIENQIVKAGIRLSFLLEKYMAKANPKASR